MGCATQGEKAAIIKALREEGYQLKHLLKGLNMPKSTYYYEISKVDTVGFRNAELTEEIKKIFDQHRRSSKVVPNIIDRDFTATAPLQKWTTDVSQFNFSWGKCYLSPIIDMYTNEVISYDLSMSPNLNQIKRMLETAFKKFKSLTGLIFHSDQGWQYQHNYYRQELKNRGIIQSMSRRGNCIDNCIIEIFFGRLKNEMYYGYEKEYESFESFSKALDEYINYYNNERIQRKTKWMPPVKYRITSMCSA